MPKIKVHKPFTLQLPDRTQRDFRPGEHEIEEGLAAHWYVKANSEPVPDPTAERAMAEEPVASAPKKTAKK